MTVLLIYQFIRRLEKESLVTLKELYIDGTKIEVNTNRYTFVWRGTLNYHLAGLLDMTDTLYTRYNTLLSENGYGPQYDLGPSVYAQRPKFLGSNSQKNDSVIIVDTLLPRFLRFTIF